MFTPVLSDEPARNCLLGRDKLVNDLSERAKQCLMPQVFGVFGDWGSGKTSFLHHVKAKLDSTPNSLTQLLWFEAWRYSSEDRPVIALLHEIRRALRWNGDAAVKAYGVFKKVTASLRRAAVTAAETGFEALTEKIGLKASASDLRDVYADQLPTDIIREQLDSALETLLNARGRARLVVFIDDLDRCHADAALRLLEGIKIYLNLSHCVFILGLNAREVQRGIEKYIPGADDGDHRAARAAEYLEKICAYAVRLPWLDPAEQRHLIRTWLSKPVSQGSGSVPNLGIPSNAAEVLAEVIFQHECLPPNPRKMKAWSNSLQQLISRRYPDISHADSEEAELIRQGWAKGALATKKAEAWSAVTKEAERLVLAACFYTFHPEIHRRLARNPALFAKLAEWARNPSIDNAHKALYGIPGVIKSDKELIPTDLDRLEPTHVSGDVPFAPQDWKDNRRNFDPSLPQVFYCQRLLIHCANVENASDLMAKWLTL